MSLLNVNTFCAPLVLSMLIWVLNQLIMCYVYVSLFKEENSVKNAAVDYVCLLSSELYFCILGLMNACNNPQVAHMKWTILSPLVIHMHKMCNNDQRKMRFVMKIK